MMHPGPIPQPFEARTIFQPMREPLAATARRLAGLIYNATHDALAYELALIGMEMALDCLQAGLSSSAEVDAARADIRAAVERRRSGALMPLQPATP